MDEYNETEEENNTLFITIYSALLMSVYTDFSTALVTCNLSIFDQQLDWANFVDHHGSRSCFDRHFSWLHWFLNFGVNTTFWEAYNVGLKRLF
jgi:hypothetical protein